MNQWFAKNAIFAIGELQADEQTRAVESEIWKKWITVDTSSCVLHCFFFHIREIGWLCRRLSSFLLFLFFSNRLSRIFLLSFGVCVLSFCLYTRRLPLIHHLTASEGAWEARHVAPSRLFLLFHRRQSARPSVRVYAYVTFAQAHCSGPFQRKFGAAFHFPAKRWIRKPSSFMLSSAWCDTI